MKVAVTVWENRISPVFDSAHHIVVADIEDRQVTEKRYENFNPAMLSHFVDELMLQKVETFICGAISEVPAQMIETSGIELIPFISGNVNDVLESFASVNSIDQEFLMPGCRRKACKKGLSVDNNRKGVNDMPRRDGTGPNGTGFANGKGRGKCNSQKGKGAGQLNSFPNGGRGFGQGRRNVNKAPVKTVAKKESE